MSLLQNLNFEIRKHPEGWMARRIVDPIFLGPCSSGHLARLMALSDASIGARERFRAAKERQYRQDLTNWTLCK